MVHFCYAISKWYNGMSKPCVHCSKVMLEEVLHAACSHASSLQAWQCSAGADGGV